MRPLDAYRPAVAKSGPAVILWNHRWEYDKNPEAFLSALYALLEHGLEFRVVLLGEVFVNVPPEFIKARERLGSRIIQFGYVDSRADYARWLWQSDIVVSTAIHEFFGVALVEALYCGCFPVLPNRLSYPQFIPPAYRARCLYKSQEHLVALLAEAVSTIKDIRAESFRQQAEVYDWDVMAPSYDALFERLVMEERTAC